MSLLYVLKFVLMSKLLILLQYYIYIMVGLF